MQIFKFKSGLVLDLLITRDHHQQNKEAPSQNLQFIKAEQDASMAHENQSRRIEVGDQAQQYCVKVVYDLLKTMC